MWITKSEGFLSIITIPTASAQLVGANVADDIVNGIGTITGMVLTFVHVSMWIIFKLLDVVLDPYVIFDLPPEGTGALYAMLNSIWQLSRDLMNIVFAIMLVVGALYVVVTTKKDFIQNHAPKFVMAIVFVNFSWFVPQVVYDIAQVAAYTVYQIPSLIPVGPGGETCRVWKENPPNPDNYSDPNNFRPCSIVTNVLLMEAIQNRSEAELEADPQLGGEWHCPLENFICYQEKAWNDPGLAASPQSRIINGLIINHARMGLLVRTTDPIGGVPGRDVNETTRVIMYVVKMVFVLVINLALFFPLLAMLVAFFARIPILWITLAFMPFVFLEFVYGKPVTSQFNITDKIWKGFVTAAFLPAIVGVPLSVGFVLINAGSQAPPPGPLTEKLSDVVPLLAGVNTFWQLMWMAIALFVMWGGVFAALKSNQMIGKFVSSIEQYGSNIGSAALKAPLALPLLPGPGGQGVSPLQALKLADMRGLSNALSQTGNLQTAIALHGARTFGAAGLPNQEREAKQAAETNKVEIKQEFDTKQFFDNRTTDDVRKNAVRDMRAKPEYNDIFKHGDEVALKALTDALVITTDDEKNKLKKAIEDSK
jgi:hypothetical protein